MVYRYGWYWVQRPEKHSAIIFVDGDKYVAEVPEMKAEFVSKDAVEVFRKAIDALASLGGGKIFVRTGTYIINSTISIPYDNISIEGEGRNTILKDNISSGHLINISSRSNISINGFKIDVVVRKPYNERGDTAEIFVTNSKNVDISSIEMNMNGYGNYGIYVRGGSQRISIDNVWIYDIALPPSNAGDYGYYAGIAVFNSMHIHITRSRIEQIRSDLFKQGDCWTGVGESGIVLDAFDGPITNVHISDTVVRGTYRGIYADTQFPVIGREYAMSNIVLTNVRTEETTCTGIYFTYKGGAEATASNIFRNVLIMGCSAINNGGVGMYLKNVKGLLVLSPYVYGTGGIGVNVYNSDGVIIEPYVLSCNNDGIALDADPCIPASVTVVGGWITGNKGVGIRVQQSVDMVNCPDVARRRFATIYSTTVENNMVKDIDVGTIVGKYRIVDVDGTYGVLRSDMFKQTGVKISVGTRNIYGSSTSIRSPSGVIKWFRTRINISGISPGEIITVRIRAVYAYGTVADLEKSFTSSGSYWLTDDDILALVPGNGFIAALEFYAKTNLSSTSATVTVDIYGHG